MEPASSFEFYRFPISKMLKIHRVCINVEIIILIYDVNSWKLVFNFMPVIFKLLFKNEFNYERVTKLAAMIKMSST